MYLLKPLKGSALFTIVCALILIHSVVLFASACLALTGDFTLLIAEAAALALVSPLLRLSVVLLKHAMAAERERLRL